MRRFSTLHVHQRRSTIVFFLLRGKAVRRLQNLELTEDVRASWSETVKESESLTGHAVSRLFNQTSMCP